MDDTFTPSRRTVLAAAAGAGVVVAGGALAACSGSSGTTGTHETDSAAGPDSGSGTTAAGQHESAAPSETSAPATHTADALAALSSIEVGKAVAAKLPDGKPAIVARPSASTAVCFSAICTHQGCTVKPGPTSLDCPCHGSRYATTTGKVIGGPAPRPLGKIGVRVEDGKVVTT